MATMRFETYLAEQGTDPRARARLMLATMGALLAMAFGGALTWTLEHLGLERVPPPSVDYAIIFEVGEPPPPPSAAPPPRPSMAAAATESTDDEPDRRPVAVDDADVDLDPVPSRAAEKGTRTAPGVPGGNGQAGAPSVCLVPPCVGTSPIGSSFVPGVRPPARPPAEDDHVQQKIAVVRANAVYSPDPDHKKLSRTKAGTMDRRSGESSVSFCVDGGGKVVDVRTRQRFPGDPEVDRICRETVSAWRFRPFTVGGHAKKTCSVVTFDIRFD